LITIAKIRKAKLRKRRIKTPNALAPIAVEILLVFSLKTRRLLHLAFIFSGVQ
jgi:hypothetical protein